MIKQLKKLLNIAQPVKYHWYELRFYYKKNGKEILNFTNQIGFVEQADVLKDREAKLVMKPLHKHPVFQPHLCNGVLTVERLAYLGYFHQSPVKP